jgi:hypothetical protein
MAAVIVPSSSRTPRSADLGRAAARPQLRLVEGGRSRDPLARVYLRRRILVGLGLVVAAAVLWLAATGAATLLRGPATTGTAATEPAPTVAAAVPTDVDSSYVVEPGDTLWSIARQLGRDGDIRPLVDELAERAGGASLSAGQRIDLRGLVD